MAIGLCASLFQRTQSIPIPIYGKLVRMKSHMSFFADTTNVHHTMLGAILPGDSTVKLQKFEIPKPSYGEVIVQTKCSTICGSDIRCIYRKYEGSEQEAYKPGTICGHEPAGVVLECGPGTRRFKVGDRVIVYHISGCGVCHDCRKGFMISCQSNEHRKSYGFQRDGGMAPYVLADEKVYKHSSIYTPL